MPFNPFHYEIETIIVSQDIIREAFNSGNYWERALQGEFRVTIRDNIHFTRRQARKRGFQYCSRGQIVRYIDNQGTIIAVVHQIRSPDGSLGASGKPDPKYLRLDDMILKTN